MNNNYLSVINLINTKTGLVLTRNQVANFNEVFEKFISEKKISKDEAVQTLTDNQEEFQRFLELILIKESYFFRNKDHFEILKNVIFPVFFDKVEFGGEKEIKVLSVGCSTGQEPISILITFYEALTGRKDFSIKIDAVDLSKQAIVKAMNGEYSNLETRGLLPEYVEKYFHQSERQTIKVKNIWLERIAYYQQNITEMLLFDNVYHVIFARNILIYFDEVRSEQVKQKLLKSLCSGGYLFLGESEIGWGMGNDIQPIKYNQSLVYRKK